MIALIFAVMVEFSPEARCVTPTGDPCFTMYDNTTDLGRAMNICEAHVMETATLPVIPTPVPGWEACSKVKVLWEKSEEARQMKQQEEDERLELDFVKKVAGEDK